MMRVEENIRMPNARLDDLLETFQIGDYGEITYCEGESIQEVNRALLLAAFDRHCAIVFLASSSPHSAIFQVRRLRTEDTFGVFTCPDCEAKGWSKLPGGEFYWDGRKRSLYCREHHDKRNAARQAARLDPTGPEYDPDFHAGRKKTQRSYYRRKLDPASPDYDPELHERQLEAKRAYAQRAKQQE
jgi:hypothetical protein